MYYGVDDSVQVQQDNPLDINKSGFKSEMFMEKMLKESSLNDLYKQEERMKKGEGLDLRTYTHKHIYMYVHTHTHTPEIQELDSNMQYLVYENHSKFIKASETIREVGTQTILTL